IRPVTRLNTVVFPAPFGPMRPQRAPWGRERSKFFTAHRPPKNFVSSRISRTLPVLIVVSAMSGLAFLGRGHTPRSRCRGRRNAAAPEALDDAVRPQEPP